MAVSIKFGAFDFQGSVERYDIRQSPRLKQIVVPRRDGARTEVASLGALVISVSGQIHASTQAALRTQFDNLKSSLLKRKDQLTLFDDRFVEAQVKSYGDTFVPGSGMLSARYDVGFLADLPFLQSIALNQDVQTVAVSPTTFNVTIGGNADTRPVIRIENTSGADIVNNIRIENLTTGKASVYIGTLLKDKTLLIDMLNRDVLNDNVSDLNSFQGQFWELKQALNQLKYTGGVTVKITTEWRDLFF